MWYYQLVWHVTFRHNVHQSFPVKKYWLWSKLVLLTLLQNWSRYCTCPMFSRLSGSKSTAATFHSTHQHAGWIFLDNILLWNEIQPTLALSCNLKTSSGTKLNDDPFVLQTDEHTHNFWNVGSRKQVRAAPAYLTYTSVHANLIPLFIGNWSFLFLLILRKNTSYCCFACVSCKVECLSKIKKN